jgi:putative DNA primase/helicase
MIDPIAGFRDAIAEAGFGQPEIIADGEIHRFKEPSDKSGKRSGWFVFYPDGIPSGAFGSWKTGASHTWCIKDKNALTAEEKADYRRAIQSAKRKRDAEQKRMHAEAATKCRELWSKASQRIDHPYIKDKSIQPYGLRQLKNMLLVPLHIDGELANLQFISPDGTKRFKSGGQKSGCYCAIGGSSDTIFVCEGFATGASIFEAVGRMVVIAFDCNNLKPVAESIRKKYPDARIVVCADDDQWTDGNPGITKGKAVADAIGADFASPHFADVSTRLSDFNDLRQMEGLDEVRRQITDNTSGRSTGGPGDDADQGRDENALDSEIKQLSELSPLEYDRKRVEVADRLGVRVSTLDKEVSKARGSESEGQGRPVTLYEPEPWPTSINGCHALDEALSIIRRHMVITDNEAYACVLWAAHEHIFDIFSHTPRLLITAPDAECGKTLLMAHIVGNMLTRPKVAESLSPAPFFRLAEIYKPAFLIDEVDAFIEKDSDLLPGINNGWEPHGCVIRCVGDDFEPREFSTHTPVAVAGINLSKKLPTATFSRSIVINLERAADDEIPDGDIYDTKKHKAAILEVGRKLARWCANNKEKIRHQEPMLPPKVRNRMADKWGPLFSIAHVAGGDWPERVKKALFGQPDLSEPSKALQLLIDIKDVLSEHERHVGTTDLIGRLSNMEDSPWKDYNFRERDDERRMITNRQLSGLLNRYGVKAKVIRIGNSTPRGYRRIDFEQAWKRYVKCIPSPYPPEKGATPQHPSNHAASSGSGSATKKKNVSDKKPPQATDHAGCCGVAENSGGATKVYIKDERI